MMQLKKLELNGFKSFGRKTELRFDHSITAIVGPNGSGKSNIVEAFRFVLGEQSIKAMRGKRGEDLIFNGAEGVSRSNRGSVKIVIDNSERQLAVDFDEVSIERVVYRDGANEYILNNSKVRLRDILELLSGIHIGVSNHHIISQGEADRILNAKPEERKEMIEDALGLKIYQYKKKESQRKLDKTKENLREVSLLRKELAPRIHFLRRQVEKIERAEEIKKTLTSLYNNYLKREYVFLISQRKHIENNRLIPEQKLNEVEQKIKESRDILSAEPIEDSKRDILLDLEDKIKNIRKEIDESLRSIGSVEGQILSYKKITEKVSNKSVDEVLPLYVVSNVAGSIFTEIDQIVSNDDLGFIKESAQRIRSLLNDLLNEYKQEEEVNQGIYSEIGELENKKEYLESEVKNKREQESSYTAEYAELQKEIEGDKEKDREGERELFRLSSVQKDLLTEISELDRLERDYNRTSELFKQELTEAGVLIGSTVLGYRNTVVREESGREIPEEELISEDREKQESRRKEIERLKIRLEEMGVTTSQDDVKKEYKDVTERDEFLAREVEDLEKSAESIKELIEELNSTLQVRFVDGMERIDKQFKDFFINMFGGGGASVKRVWVEKRSEDDPENEVKVEGVDVTVSLPQKKIKGLMMLSGGERALTSIALTFAISQVNPPPFLVLDETDAALDEANSRRYGDMISILSKHSQLIVITHNRETMTRAGMLYGVTMGGEGISRTLSVKLEEAKEVVGE